MKTYDEYMIDTYGKGYEKDIGVMLDSSYDDFLASKYGTKILDPKDLILKNPELDQGAGLLPACKCG